MNFSNLALLTALASTSITSVSAFAFHARNSGPRSPAFLSTTTSSSSSALGMIYPGSSPKNVVAFTTTIHREEVDLSKLSTPQLKQMQFELETINERCTEEGTQTNPECDVELKDERDYAILQIQRLVSDRTGKNSKLKYVDMDVVRDMATKPWTFPLAKIRQQVEAMEILNCECTEDGNQTDAVCDVQLKDERDGFIETLSMYIASVEKMLATEHDILIKEQEEAQKEAARNLGNTGDAPEICRDARAVDKEEAAAAEAPLVVFDMGEIQDCVDHPGSRSVVDMTAMLNQLERAHDACTEEGTQTNPECDIQVKAERDNLMEALVSQIHDARLCMDQIKAFASQGDKLEEVAVEEVMEAVINTIPNLPTNSTTNARTNSIYQGPPDEYLVQI